MRERHLNGLLPHPPQPRPGPGPGLEPTAEVHARLESNPGPFGPWAKRAGDWEGLLSPLCPWLRATLARAAADVPEMRPNH